MALWADFEQKSRTLCFCMVHSLQALSKSGCWDARHERTLTNPVQKRSVRLSHGNLEHGVSLFRRWGAFWADFEQKSRTLCFCMVYSLQALSKSGRWDARHESTLTNPALSVLVTGTLSMALFCLGLMVWFTFIRANEDAVFSFFGIQWDDSCIGSNLADFVAMASHAGCRTPRGLMSSMELSFYSVQHSSKHHGKN